MMNWTVGCRRSVKGCRWSFQNCLVEIWFARLSRRVRYLLSFMLHSEVVRSGLSLFKVGNDWREEAIEWSDRSLIITTGGTGNWKFYIAALEVRMWFPHFNDSWKINFRFQSIFRFPHFSYNNLTGKSKQLFIWSVKCLCARVHQRIMWWLKARRVASGSPRILVEPGQWTAPFG